MRVKHPWVGLKKKKDLKKKYFCFIRNNELTNSDGMKRWMSIGRSCGLCYALEVNSFKTHNIY